MRILVAADKFKGSMSAAEACAAIARGVRGIFAEADVVEMPVADGGEGTAEVLRAALGGEWVEVSVSDPIGRKVSARYAVVESGGEKTAVMEMSAASGLWRVREEERDPRIASTYGTGRMMADAMREGAAKIILGIGGSATNDGGTGMAEALGFHFRDFEGHLLEGLPEGLERLAAIERPARREFPKVVVACDVTNPLLGERGATRVYGGQKGVREEEMDFFEERLRRLAEVAERDLGTEARERPGAGAAGGLGFGLMVFCGAELRGGFRLVAETIGLAEEVGRADLVLTGEGKIDAQTAEGKAPAGVAMLAGEGGVPVVAYGGLAESGGIGGIFDAVATIGEANPGMVTEESMRRGAELLEAVVRGSEGVLRKVLPGGAAGV